MRYIDASIRTFLKDCAAKTPAPGGGAVAAWAAAASAALIEMAAGFALGKPKYKAVAKTMRAIRKRAAAARRVLERLIDEDIAVYRRRDMRRAVAVPLRVAILARVLLDDARTLILKGNRNLKSDAGLAAFLAETAFLASGLYATVNVKSDASLSRLFGRDLARLKKAVPQVRRQRRKTEAALGYSSGR